MDVTESDNTLAYYVPELITDLKRFIKKAPGLTLNENMLCRCKRTCLLYKSLDYDLKKFYNTGLRLLSVSMPSVTPAFPSG
jgi:hypothetical protein